jgi:hypothetical protein
LTQRTSTDLSGALKFHLELKEAKGLRRGPESSNAAGCKIRSAISVCSQTHRCVCILGSNMCPHQNIPSRAKTGVVMMGLVPHHTHGGCDGPNEWPHPAAEVVMLGNAPHHRGNEGNAPHHGGVVMSRMAALRSRSGHVRQCATPQWSC